MDKSLEQKITKLVKERCNELLSQQDKRSFDYSSFAAGYLCAITDQIIFAKKED